MNQGIIIVQEPGDSTKLLDSYPGIVGTRTTTETPGASGTTGTEKPQKTQESEEP